MATSKTAGWDRGYQQALNVLFDEARAQSPAERRELKKKRMALEESGDYQGARRGLDMSPDETPMSRFTAMFYLSMSPAEFADALDSGPHPFAEPRGGSTKGEVDRWFKGYVIAKHADAMAAEELPKARPLRVSRDLSSGRPYLVDASGTILADGMISNIAAGDVAYAASQGAGIRILSLTAALAMPWRDPIERQGWADWRHGLLVELSRKADVALAQARAEDLEATFPEKPPGGRCGL